MTSHDLLVLGAGPAGAHAAMAAAECGLDVAIIDDSRTSGGQVYRAPPEDFEIPDDNALSPDFVEGQTLRQAVDESDVHRVFGRQVWMVSPGFQVDTVGPNGPEQFQAPRLIAATGTYERVIPFPGWTKPGVIGLAASTILLKCQHMLPGERTVVAGVGPLVAAVAAGIVKGGGQLAAVVDLSGPSDWLKALPALVLRPDLLMRGIGWLRQVYTAGVPILYRHTVVSTEGENSVNGVTVAPVTADWQPSDGHRRHFKADALSIGHGLVPATDISILLGAKHDFHAASGGWVPRRDDDFKTTVPGFSVVGDGGGIVGAAASGLQGRWAGLHTAHEIGRIDEAEFERRANDLGARLSKARTFGAAMAAMMALRPGLAATINADTVVCRCEDVTREDIMGALTAGARDVNQLKSWTRCGMGPCQGRMCGEATATLVASHVGGRKEAGIWTTRVPLRPLPIDVLTGDFSYHDIPKPAPAPA